MHQNSLFHTLLTFIPIGAFAFADLLAVPGSAASQDVAQYAVDVAPTELGDTDEIDPKSVAVSSDGTHLTLVFDAGQDVEEYLRHTQAGSMAEIWIDTDVDVTTGGSPFFGDAVGFDYTRH